MKKIHLVFFWKTIIIFYNQKFILFVIDSDSSTVSVENSVARDSESEVKQVEAA